MGIIITKFRKKKTTEELLETLERDIQCIETNRKDTEQSQRKIVGGFLLTSIIVYLGMALLFYFYFFPATIYERMMYIIPLLLAPIIIVISKKALTFFYSRQITKNQEKLKRLNDEKKKILEKVMETETYKVAKSILEKYAPEQIVKNPSVPSMDSLATPKSNALVRITSPAPGLRHRVMAMPKTPSVTAIYKTPARPDNVASPLIQRSNALVPSTGNLQMTPMPLPRTILPRERSVFDKVVEYLVGDGPSNRYALICKQCSSHNGMALKEEFEYLSFKCCYCYTFNPARKMRPAAPKLESESPQFTRPAIADGDTSDSEKNSVTESENEPDTLIVEEGVHDIQPVCTELEQHESEESEWKTETESGAAES